MYSGSACMLSGSAVSMATHRTVRGKADAFSSYSESLQIQTVTLSKIRLKIGVYRRGGNNINENGLIRICIFLVMVCFFDHGDSLVQSTAFGK